MASTFTTNVSAEKPANGDYVGTWDTIVNGNMNTYDSAIGTIQAISLAAGSVTLSTAQARSAFLNFNGALIASVTVTIPGLSSAPGTTVSGKGYTVQNQCSNSSAFTVTLATTVAGQQQIALPPYELVDILIEGTNSSQAGSIKFRNLDRVGTYWDYAGSSVPAWISGCTVPPYLNCDGTAFSSVTYPALSVVLAGTTLPDSRGRYRAVLNQGQSRITSGSSTGGVDGNTILASGGAQTTTLSSQNVPPVPYTDPGHSHTVSGNTTGFSFSGSGGGFASTKTSTDTVGITIGSTSPTNFSNLPPTYVGGLTLIRAA